MGGVPILYQPHGLMDALSQGNALRQAMVNSYYQPQQLQNQNALAQAQIQQAQNTANYGDGQLGGILAALANPNIPEDQKNSLKTALTMSSLYRPGQPNDPTTQAVRTSTIANDPNLSGGIQGTTGMTPEQLYQQQLQQYQSKTAQQSAAANQKNAQADLLYPSQAEYYTGRGQQAQATANQLIPSQVSANQARALQSQATAQQLIPSQVTANQARALEAQQRANLLIPAQANSVNSGGAKGVLLGNLMNGQYGDLPDGIAQQAAIGSALAGVTPEVKRNFEYRAADGDPAMQESIQGANIKATSNQILLRKQAAMETFDSAVQPVLGQVAQTVSHYSGPGGAAKLALDRSLYLTTGHSSPEYTNYLTTMQTLVPLIADNAANVLGAQKSDEMNRQLQGIIGPGNQANLKSLAMMTPQAVYDKINTFSGYLKREAETGRQFIGPLDMTKVTSYGGYSADQVSKIMKATGMNFDAAKTYLDSKGGAK